MVVPIGGAVVVLLVVVMPVSVMARGYPGGTWCGTRVGRRGRLRAEDGVVGHAEAGNVVGDGDGPGWGRPGHQGRRGVA